MTTAAVSGETQIFLATAAQIGRRLCTEAIWHDDRCNWVGASNDEGAYGSKVTFGERAGRERRPLLWLALVGSAL